MIDAVAEFQWHRLFAVLPGLLAVIGLLIVVSLAARSMTFGPLLIEARAKKMQRRYQLSDLVALMVLLQFAAATSLAFSRRPGFELRTLEWNEPLDSVATAALMIVIASITTWWWCDSAWMLNAARVDSGRRRFTFLVVWTPIGYLSHWMLFIGGCGVFSTIMANESGIDWRGNILRISPIFYVGIGFFVMLTVGTFGAIFTRWASNRLADIAFNTRIENFRQRHDSQTGNASEDESEDDIDEDQVADNSTDKDPSLIDD